MDILKLETLVINFMENNTFDMKINSGYPYEMSNSPKMLSLIGIDKEEEYNYLIKKIWNKISERKNSLLLQKGFEPPSDIELIKNIQDGLSSMDLNNIQNEEIILTNDDVINSKVKKAISLILAPALQVETFNSDNAKKNFIIKQIVWLYTYLNKFNFYDFTNNPLLIIYGSLNDEQVYQLEMLEVIGVSVIYINSLEEIFFKIPNPIKDANVISFDRFQEVKPISYHVSQAKDSLNVLKPYQKEIENYASKRIDSLKAYQNGLIGRNDVSNSSQEELSISDDNEEVVTTWAKKAKSEFQEQLISDEGVFMPWQFAKGTTKEMRIDAVLEDLSTYWTQEARFRPSFKVEGDTVYIPSFMVKVNGAKKDLAEYKKIIDDCKNAPLTIFREGVDLLSNSFNKEDICKFVFTMIDDEFDYEKVKNYEMYNLKDINIDVQNFLLRKLNEFYKKYIELIDRETILNLGLHIINMSNEYKTILSNFDFPFKIPKLVIYIDDRTDFDNITGLFINYLSFLGVDIAIFSPTGSPSIENHAYNRLISIINLDEMRFDLGYLKIREYKDTKKSFFKRIFDI